jgi:hypothetical protein
MDSNKETGKTKLISILAFIMLLVLVIGVAFFVYLKSNDIDLKTVSLKDLFINKIKSEEQKMTSSVWELKSETNEQPEVIIYGDYLVKCTKDRIEFYNKESQSVWNKSLQINNPVPKVSGDELLVADYGGRELYVFKDKDIKWYKKTDGNIIRADISASGYVSVIQEAKGYKGAVTVLNLQGNPFFTRNAAESYLIDAKVSSSGKNVLMNSVDTSGVQVSSQIELTDMLGKPSFEKVIFENSVFASSAFLGNDSVVLASDSSVVSIGKDGKSRWNKDFESGKVYSMTTSMEKLVILAVSDEKSGLLQGSSSEVLIINTSGSQTASYKLQGQVKNLVSIDDVIAVNNGQEIDFINTRGKLITKYASKTAITNVYFFNRQQAVVVTKSGISMVEVR